MTFSGEVYPNSPLVEVVFEIRFPGELAIECERHLFWEKIRERFPKIYVPAGQTDRPPSLVPYRFSREDDLLSVLVAINSLALTIRENPYPGFKKFSDEILSVYKLFGSAFAIDKLTRVGWRYVNIIPFVRENGLIPLQNFLKLGFKVPQRIPERFNALSLSFNAKTNGGSITTRLETILNESTKQEALLLDFDYAKEGDDLHFADVSQYLDEAHAFTRELFEEFITDEYRQYLRGDVI